MKQDIKVKDVMSTRLITLHPKDSILRAKEVFAEYSIHHIPICVMNEVRGIISLGDILFLEGMVLNSFDQFVKDKKNQNTPIEDVMTRNPYHTASDALLSTAINKMVKNRINALPVVDNNEIVGLITTHDVLEAFNEILNNI